MLVDRFLVSSGKCSPELRPNALWNQRVDQTVLNAQGLLDLVSCQLVATAQTVVIFRPEVFLA